MAQAPVSLEVLPLHTSLTAGEEVEEHILIRLRAASAVASGPPVRLSAVLVVDASGSMAGEPIRQVVQSARRIAGLLNPNDRLAVVAFSDAARTVCALRALDAAGRAELERELNLLKAGGGTNLSAGLSHAALLLPPPEPDERQLLLLLSDGQPNQGTTKPEMLAEEARQVRARGVAVSTLGFGSAHDERPLQAMAEAAGGRYAFVSDPALADGSFARALGAQRDIVADAVRLRLAPASGVRIVRVFDDPPQSFGADGLELSLQDLLAGEERNVLVALRVTPSGAGAWAALQARLVARSAGAEFQVAQGSEHALAGAGSLRGEVALVLALARAAQARAEARALADKGAFPAAAARLKQARDELATAPGVEQALPLVRDALLALGDDIAAMEQHPDAEQYQRYKRAAQDYGAFAQAGAKASGNVALSPSAQAMLGRLQQVTVPNARLVNVDNPGESFPLGPETTLGRSASNQIVVPTDGVTRMHARVNYRDGKFFVTDLGSSNGTFLNGQKVSSEPLKHGDEIVLSRARYRFELV